MVTLVKEAIYSIYINQRYIFTNNHACPCPQHGNNHFKIRGFFRRHLCYPRTNCINFELIQQKGRKHLFLTPLRETKRTWAMGKLVIKDSSYFPSGKDTERVHFLSLILLSRFPSKICDVFTLLLLRKQQLRKKKTKHIPC